jgi:hypothetical protein
VLATGRTVSLSAVRQDATDSQLSPVQVPRGPTQHTLHFVPCFLAPADAVCRSSDLSSSSSSHDGGDEHHSCNSSSSTLVYSSRNVRTVNFQRSQIPVTDITHNLLRCTQRPFNRLNSPLYLIRSPAGTITHKYVLTVPDSNSIGRVLLIFRLYVWLRST